MIAGTTTEWKCAGCGMVTTDLIQNCKCITEVLYRRADGKTLYETKLPNEAELKHLVELAQRLAEEIGSLCHSHGGESVDWRSFNTRLCRDLILKALKEVERKARHA